MQNKQNPVPTQGRTFGRRSFVKGTAATLGVIALSAGIGCGPQNALEEGSPSSDTDELYQGVCRGNCGGGCRMNVHVREGKVVKTSMIPAEDPLDDMICGKGLSHAQRMYAPERVQYPMRRVEGTERGAGEWERLSWDEAISYICEKWQGYMEEFGPTSIGYTFGAGTYALNQYIYMRLFNMIGATNYGQEYDMAALEQGWRMYGMSDFLIGNNRRDMMDAKYIFTWAHNTTVADLPRWVLLKEAMAKGAKHIVIDPNFTDAAAKSDMWVPIKAGTDSALAMAMTKVIIDEGLQDVEFLTQFTVAPYLIKPSDFLPLKLSDLGVAPTEGPINPMTGQPTVIDPVVVMGADGAHGTLEEVQAPVINGTFTIEGFEVTTAFDLLTERVSEWTPEAAAAITEVPAETIVELARMFAEGPTTLNIGFGNDHWGNGASTTHCQLTLPLVTGQVGKPGAGVSGSQGGAGSGYAGANMAGVVFPEGAVGGLTTALLYLPEIMETGMYGQMPFPVKSLFNYCGNPLSSHCDREALIKAFDKIELIINVDTIMNDTSRYSDVILPVPHWFEYDTALAYPSDFCDINEKAIDPQFECKSDIEIGSLLGIGMGFEDTMTIDSDEYHTMILDTDIARASGLSWEDLREKKRIRIRDKEYYYGREEHPFVSPSGRGEFYIENPTPRHDYGQQLDKVMLSLPFFELPIEAYDENPLKEQYPLTLISYRDKFKVHTSFAPCPWFTEIQPEPSVMINPADAEARGIADDDYVKVFNDRGFVKLKAHIDPSMRPGIAKTEHTWLDEQYVEGHYASLTSIATRHFKPSNSPFDTLCQIEKA